MARRPPSRCGWVSTTTTEQKARLRREITALERSLSPEQRKESDQALFRRFLARPEVQAGELLFLFCGMGTEPDTMSLFDPLLVRGKLICLPRCLPGGEMELRRYLGRDHLLRHRYGMWEPDLSSPPVLPEAVELALIPALCYDRSGVRLGRGGGFYDRFLARYQGISLGLCRDLTLQPEVPREPHDMAVDLVLTETEAIQKKK